MFALFGLSCTRFANYLSCFAKKSLSWSTACWNGQISSGILRQERKIILMEFPPLEWVIISINCRKFQVSGNFACPKSSEDSIFMSHHTSFVTTLTLFTLLKCSRPCHMSRGLRVKYTCCLILFALQNATA